MPKDSASSSKRDLVERVGVAVRRGLVVDDDRLAKGVRNLFADHARDDIGCSARGNRDQDVDRVRRELRSRAPRQQKGEDWRLGADLEAARRSPNQ